MCHTPVNAATYHVETRGQLTEGLKNVPMKRGNKILYLR